MRIAFIRACNPEIPYQVSLPPLGIGYLAAYLKQKYWFAELTYHHTVDEVIAAKPDLVGISSATENYNSAVAIAQRIKDELGIPIIAGGIHITSLPHTLPDVFDVGAIGEGEITFTELVRLYHDCSPTPADLAKIQGICFHENGGVRVTALRDLISNLDVLPYPDRDMLGDGWKVPHAEQAHLITSRGCPYNCAFCASALHWRVFRYFSAEYVAKEIEYLRNKYDPEEIYFFDDLFIGHLKRFKEICRLIKERQLHEGVTFRSYGRVDLINKDLADLFHDLHFNSIDFGFEANTQKILTYYNKNNVTPEHNQTAIDLLTPHGISLGANLIIGAPPETLDDMEETFRFVERNKNHLDRVSMGPLFALPGTRVWEEARTKGIVNDTMDWSRLGFDADNFDLKRYPYLCEQVSPEKFYEFYLKFHQLAREINYVGQLRQLARIRAKREAEIARQQSELATLKGSRLVRLALTLRRMLSRVLRR
jgi:radical SAM superfamily enzyme YgiQ (UPF0313 family)